ncbi:AAA family ATPase [Vibrio splendidus]|uniref:AAA family ATPase n=1 Tax=Vibrio splendidus TaxID=29497 RepID=UPI001F53302F|nr:DUF3696 domain-containing protein [Vibrio splendidus]
MIIKNIDITGFKSFPKKSIPLSNLTLLSGLNNSGKSSVIQSLRMFQAGIERNSPYLKDCGYLEQIRSKFVSPTSNVSFNLTYEDGSTTFLEINESNYRAGYFGQHITYIGADRLGPQRYLQMTSNLDDPITGDQGEFIYDYIDKHIRFNFIAPEPLFHPSAKSATFEYQLKGWLNEIAPGAELDIYTDNKSLTSTAQIDGFMPTNVGFGLSYTLPILAAVLGAVSRPETYEGLPSWLELNQYAKDEMGQILLIENPEAHLHPSGQTAMGIFLAKAAACGIQVIVETHSDHVMDGVRLAVKEQVVTPSQVEIHFFKKDSEGRSQLETPKIDEQGKMEFWPVGFFDQTLINRSKLAKRGR